MKLDEIVAWYQKKIGTYDKQQWEKTVEQKILNGFTSVTLKNAKLKTEFIDVDLVRGSTFPKAKPKQSLITVIKFAILRYFFLPIYAKWWVSQTSPIMFFILLLLYITQMINWGVYTFNIHKVGRNPEHVVSISEMLTPMALGLILSFIHSQIVATNSVNNTNSAKRKRMFTNTEKSRERIRRRRKLIKVRSTEYESNNRYCCNKTIYTRRNSTTLMDGTQTVFNRSASPNVLSSSAKLENSKPVKPNHDIAITEPTEQREIPCQTLPSIVKCNLSSSDLSPLARKRNVNWDSPIHNYANSSFGKSPSGIEQKSTQIDETVREFYDDLVIKIETNVNSNIIDKDENALRQDEHRRVISVLNGPHREAIVVNNNNNNNGHIPEATGDDDGFESFNGKSSSGEENHGGAIANGAEEPAILPCINNSINKINHVENNLIEVSESQGLYANSNLRLRYPRRGSTNFPIKKSYSHDETLYPLNASESVSSKPKGRNTNRISESSDTDEEGDVGEITSSPTAISNANYTECTTSATEWLGVTTNSDECSYSSEFENDSNLDHDYAPTVILNPSSGSSDRINCTIWEHHDIKKAEMSVLDISSCIIERVEGMPETCDYLYLGVVFTIILSFIPIFCRLCEATEFDNSTEFNYFDIPFLLMEKTSFSFLKILKLSFGESSWEKTILIISFAQRICLTFILFFLFAVAERTFKQRFLYAKLFSHLTSSRRAQKSNLPHFRLNKVRNIKTWLSVRSYLKKRGPQRSVDVIVSAAFIIALSLLAFLSVEWLKDSTVLHSQLNLEALLWSSALGIYLLRFMTLGNKINRKYRSISVLITEQINLYLQIEQKPKKKEELMVSNSVLKLAGDLLKELETPFKISGLSANPYLYTTIKVVILSALSGVLSEMLGFKLKLHKIKIK